MDMVLEFERPLVELKKRIQTLQDMQEADGPVSYTHLTLPTTPYV